MTPITLPRATVEQALEALEDAKALLNNKDRTTTMWFADEITALRAALAQQAEPVQEPVAWRDSDNSDPGQGCTYDKAKAARWPHIYKQPLYTAPPQQAEPVQEPITRLFGTLPVHDAQQAEPDAYGYASRLAVAIWEKHYKDTAPHWKPLDDLVGVLTQIDNMVAGMTRLAQQAEPVTWVGDPSTQDYASTVPDPQIEDRLARHGIPMPGDPK